MINNVNTLCPSFKSNYVISYPQINETDSETMKQVGKITSDFVTSLDDIAKTDEGIVVKIDDNRDKEYESIMSKYGFNIRKYDGNIGNYNNASSSSYQLTNSDKESKNKEFKNGDFSTAKQQLQKTNLKPTNAPIVKFVNKDGEEFMAREVVLENGYKCMAIASERNPQRAILMNKDEFKKFFVKNINNISNDSLLLKGTKAQQAKGEFVNKNFEIKCEEGLSNYRLSGKIDDLSFNINHQGKALKPDVVTGNIGNKELNLKFSSGLMKDTIVGNIADEPVNLKLTASWNGYNLNGKFKNKDINIKILSETNGFNINGDDISLLIKGKDIFSNDIKINGMYKNDFEFVPILMDLIYCIKNTEDDADVANAAAVAAYSAGVI